MALAQPPHFPSHVSPLIQPLGLDMTVRRPQDWSQPERGDTASVKWWRNVCILMVETEAEGNSDKNSLAESLCPAV